MAKILKSIDIGILKVEDISLDCAVLEDGTRVITTGSILKAFGRTQRGWYKGREEKLLKHLKDKYPENRLQQLPIFMDSKALISVIDEKAISLLQSISYIYKGVEKEGFSALILPKICDLYLKARRENKLNFQQKHLAAKSEILLTALSQIGIIALVDEATGYQYNREAQELQKLLKAYISQELLPWQKRFPDIFYKEIFRLKKWDYTVNGIKNRPSVIGTWTNKLIYQKLPKGVLKQLKEETPKNEKGKRKHRFHQLLTLDIGHSDLQRQLTSVITIMQLSKTWKEFEKSFNQLYGQTAFDFEIEEKEKDKKNIELSNFNNSLKKGLDFKPKKEK